jgi:hypothetical protein
MRVIAPALLIVGVPLYAVGMFFDYLLPSIAGAGAIALGLYRPWIKPMTEEDVI